MLVSRLEDWEFSSFKDYAGMRNGDLCQKDLAIKLCSYDPENFESKSIEMVEKKLIPYFR